MIFLQNARARLASVLEEIGRLKQSEFPYSHPLDALTLIENRFKEHQAALFDKTLEEAKEEKILNLCRQSLQELHKYVPILGFLLRATNIRNAFEMHGPLQRLAEKILGSDIKLIVSSEWEFSPFVYRAITGLGNFVLIGFPASESPNPLLSPIAAHELGHSVWERNDFAHQFDDEIKTGIFKEIVDNRWDDYSRFYPQYSKNDVQGANLFAPRTVLPAHTWAMLQIEEMFCDFLGLQIFAESYLYAFAHIASPGGSGQRSLRYPNIKRRISHLVDAAEKLNITAPEEYRRGFLQEREPDDPLTSLLVSVADTISASLAEKLIGLVQEVTHDRIHVRNAEIVEKIALSFREYVVPIKETTSLTDIVNAGWKCNMYKSLWEDVLQIKGREEEEFLKNRERVLCDIMLKSMEITEVYERLSRIS